MKYFYFFFLILFTHTALSQDHQKAADILPETVFGEWQGNTGNGEYNGLLIHPNFIEFGYRAFMYRDIQKDDNGIFHLEAQDMQENAVSYQLEVLTKDSIKLKRGNNPSQVFVKHEDPLQAKRIKMAEVPDEIKATWFTTDGENNPEFKVGPQQIIFRDKTYIIEEVVHFRPNETGEYRFVVKNGKEYWMFYFKNWDEHYLQVGFNGDFGDWYKASKEYPDYRIDNFSEYLSSKFPQELRGDWLKTDGSNAWAFSFHYDYAVLNKEIWNYKAVEQKGKLYKITLAHDDKEKIIYARSNKDKTASFGNTKKALTTYTTSSINKPDFKLANDAPYKEKYIFKADSATYSGIIRGFNVESNEKTGMVYVHNIFTGKQDSYLVNIQDNGRFSVKFPSYYPQQIYVRFPSYNISVLVEPGKETWQLINANKPEGVFFAGDAAQLNTDLMSLAFITRDFSFYNNVIKHVDDLSLEAYKEKCFSFYDRQVKKRDSVLKTRFISNKAQQVFDLDLDYNLYMNMLSYDIHSKERNSSKIDSAYISFLTPKIYNNKLAVVSSGYSSFINRLRFVPPMRGDFSVTHPNVTELAEILKSKNIVLSEEEKELVAMHKKYNEENATALRKQKAFNEKYQDVLRSYGGKISSVFQKLSEEERNEIFDGGSLNFNLLNTFIKSKNLEMTFTDKEIAYQKAQENLMTEEEQERAKMFYSPENNKRNRDFLKKHKVLVDVYVSNELKRQQTEKVRSILGNTFSAEVIMAQNILGSMSRNFIPLTEDELSASQEELAFPFIANVIKVENEKMKAKIEANKAKTDFVANETPKTEADNIFEAIISKYKGKVVFIDFWATWCGPCRSGMKKMKPLKEELKDKDIVFVYITDPSSPETTYNNMIPDIKGEHYRVSKDEWNYLAQKFNISGIPHYTLVNKEGQVVKDKLPPVASMDGYKQMFEEELGK